MEFLGIIFWEYGIPWNDRAKIRDSEEFFVDRKQVELFQAKKGRKLS